MHPTVRFALLLACIVPVAARAADDVKALTGTWKPTQAELGGAPMPPPVLQSITLKLDGTYYEVAVQTPKGVALDKGTVALESATNPKGMTVTGVEGPNAGKTFPAIYALEGDTLRICYDLSGAKRPAEFKSAPDTKLYLVTYQRAK
jgi:uncharacterized protein (TIGR03067 family)